jgi:hypothetical protein
VADDERVVAVAHLPEMGEDEEGGDGQGEGSGEGQVDGSGEGNGEAGGEEANGK